MNDKIKGLPIGGYRDQNSSAIELVNHNKHAEERILRTIDHLMTLDGVDKRWLAIGRTAIEQGFMALNRGVFVPSRIAQLPEDKDQAGSA